MADETRRTEPPPEPRGDVHVYNQPASGNGGGPGLVIGIVVVVLLIAALWFAFGRGGRVVPEQIDIDVNLPDAPAPTAPQQPPPSEPAPQPTQPPAPPPNPGPGGDS